MLDKAREIFELALDFLIQKFGPMGPIYAIAALGVLLILAALMLLMGRKTDVNERLEGARRDRYEQAATNTVRRDQGDNDGLEKFASYLEPQDAEEYSEARLSLMRAGYRSRSAVRVYSLVRAGLALSLMVLVLLFFTVVAPDSGQFKMVTAVACAGGLGYLLPAWWISRRRREREQEITNGFPDALDLLLVCVEAGHSLDQAVGRVSNEIRTAIPALSEEFESVSLEMRVGKDRTSVLRDFADRCGVPDISSFVTVLIQSAAFGTSVADALRTYSAEMRDKRLVRAEEKANVLPTKLTLGTMMFTVPPLLLILVGPSLIEVLRSLSGMAR